ncbi:MAG: hypothetical protein IM673_08370 [Phenylobacterium sp.]|uniref:hypothetical protein n=1 Tax=Phenylobacterium sp. TaxID=1871053 RepID=UPI0025D87C2D|nr:hypothetical protein [Phenylobacterium sp.]MCA3738055.1 hypothetical protein [Phenylobacterium sp.]MCA3754041.1 hypothetical protein [Phenylobacterium sp.]
MEREPTPEWLERESALDEVYMACLGWFVHAFASTESMLFRLLVEKSGLSGTEGAAVFSGLRMKAAMDALNRLFDVRDMKLEKEALARPFAQLGAISSIRDDLLHYGTEEDDLGGLYVSNVSKKHIPERATTRPVSAQDLIHMVHDLRDIEIHFVASMFRTSKKSSRRTAGLYTNRLASEWQYRPRVQHSVAYKERK